MTGDRVFAPPIGPWQVDTGTLVRCERHRNWCAYRANDPTRCSRCHTLWEHVESRAGHEAEHDREDAEGARKAAYRERAKSGAGRPRQAPNGGTPVVDTYPGV